MDFRDRLRLDDQLCFALYAATNAVTRAYRPMLHKIGLTYPQYLAMLVLWQDGPRTVGAMAERLHLPPNAIGPLLDMLERAGLVERRRNEDDRRVVDVSLTEAGANLEHAAHQVQQAVVCQTGLDQGALRALREDLQELVGRLEPDEVRLAAVHQEDFAGVP